MPGLLRWLLRGEKGSRETPPKKPIQLQLEELEKRVLFNASPWLGRQFEPVEGVSGFTTDERTFHPVTTNLNPETGLSSGTASYSGCFTLDDTGWYSFTYTEDGSDGSGTYTFNAIGYVTFILYEAGDHSNGCYSFASTNLDQTASITYTYRRTPTGGSETMQSDNDEFSLEEAPFDPFQPET